jgi:hypothetical protein
MGKGIVKITPKLLLSGLGSVPADWEIESIHMNPGDEYATAVITGFDFPEVHEDWHVRECRIIVHTGHTTFEVQEIL